jgi:hypothetical protein
MVNHFRLESVKLEGYLGACPGNPIVLDNLQAKNILIGPNNSGKSVLFRFLHLVRAPLQHQLDESFVLQHDSFVPDSSNWWEHDQANDIKAEFRIRIDPEFREEDGGYREIIDGDGCARFDVRIFLRQSRPTLVVDPYLRSNNSWHPMFQREPRSSVKCFYPSLGNYGSMYATNDPAQQYHLHFLKLLKEWIAYTKFFDPVRALDRGQGFRRMDDGSQLIVGLAEQSNNQRDAFRFHQIRSRTLEYVNLLLDPTGQSVISNFEIKGTQKEGPSLWVTINNNPLPLQALGTGVSELVLICASLAMEESHKSSMTFFIEEPEVHLHPALLRRFVNLLSQQKLGQFFITTHSSTLLEAIGKNDAIFHMTQDDRGRCQARRCSEFHELHNALDSLGFNGACLLQANCTIWVEGPSDRTYIRSWLNQADETLIEGSDYSFVFYGGANLSHFDLNSELEEDSNVAELIAMLAISRFSAVIMDRDLAPDASMTALTPAKQRILASAGIDSNHRLAIVTTGRTIENDVARSYFLEGLRKLAVSVGRDIDGLRLRGIKSFQDEVMDHWDIAAGERPNLRRRLDKVRLAGEIASIINAENNTQGNGTALEARTPPWIDELRKFVINSRVQ